MITKKQEIIDRLLEKKQINSDEAVELMRENIQIVQMTTNQTMDESSHYSRCGCNPANGGSGLCGCILSTRIIY